MRAQLDPLKCLVEQNLDSPVLSAEFICARSGWSRATVYRLFKAEGGLARYIRRCHLQRAYQELLSGRPHRRLIDLAVAHQFASEATFSRAFRRAFGVPPGRARELAAGARGAGVTRAGAAVPPGAADATGGAVAASRRRRVVGISSGYGSPPPYGNPTAIRARSRTGAVSGKSMYATCPMAVTPTRYQAGAIALPVR